MAAGPERIFELIADPAQQPRWDGNDNLAEAPAGQRVRRTGEVFTMTLTHDGAIRENHVVEFDEGPPDCLETRRSGQAAARAPVALGTQAGQRITHPGHLHLRQDSADRPQALRGRPGDHSRQAPGVA